MGNQYEKDEQGYLYYIDNKDRMIVPKSNQQKILEVYHDMPFGGHRTTELTELQKSSRKDTTGKIWSRK